MYSNEQVFTPLTVANKRQLYMSGRWSVVGGGVVIGSYRSVMDNAVPNKDVCYHLLRFSPRLHFFSICPIPSKQQTSPFATYFKCFRIFQNTLYSIRQRLGSTAIFNKATLNSLLFSFTARITNLDNFDSILLDMVYY